MMIGSMEDVVVILNKMNKRIKDLEKEVAELKSESNASLTEEIAKILPKGMGGEK